MKSIKNTAITATFIIITIMIVATAAGKLINITKLVCSSNTILHISDYWKLVSSIFVHSNPEHLITNAIGLFAISIMLNKKHSGTSFIALFLISGTLTNLLICIYCYFMEYFFYLSGCSGSLFFFLPVLITLIFKSKTIPIFVKAVTIIFFVYSFYISYYKDIVSFLSHIIGFILGIIYCTYYLRFARK